jgi:hypothetical protein
MAPSVGTLIWMPVYLRPHIASTLLGQSTRAVHDLRSGIATMVKPPAGVRDRNGTQRLCDGVLKSRPGPRHGGVQGGRERRLAALHHSGGQPRHRPPPAAHGQTGGAWRD